LQPFDGETALTRVISTVDLSGHTPGHSGFRIADDGESLLIVGDALFHPALHPARTDVGIAFETDPAAAAKMRRRLFPLAAQEHALLAATHMPFPGFGRIVRDIRAVKLAGYNDARAIAIVPHATGVVASWLARRDPLTRSKVVAG
jgi:glyoxylase-like metal-dependent hydrolase (beta-lactamase superfamily II)